MNIAVTFSYAIYPFPINYVLSGQLDMQKPVQAHIQQGKCIVSLNTQHYESIRPDEE